MSSHNHESMGTVVLDETIFPIIAIRLADGATQITARGPITRTFPSGVYGWVVFGPDGIMVARGRAHLEGVRNLVGDDHLRITLCWHVTDKLCDSAREGHEPERWS